MEQFDCCGEENAGDTIAVEVNAFIPDDCIHGTEHQLNTTILLLRLEEDVAPQVIGYATLCFDTIRLTSGERDEYGSPEFPDVSAVRIVMIGIDWRHAREGHGSLLLDYVTGLARSVAGSVAVRFLVADVNLLRKNWYEKHMFVPNRSQQEERKGMSEGERFTLSMRLDLQTHEEALGNVSVVEPRQLSRGPLARIPDLMESLSEHIAHGAKEFRRRLQRFGL